MRKVALLLALVMLLSCSITFTSCGNKQSKETMDDKISEEVRYTLMAKIAAHNAIYDDSLVYFSHTITITTVKEGEQYKVKGTVYAMENGTKYSTTYSGEVEYDSASEEFDSDITMGKF